MPRTRRHFRALVTFVTLPARSSRPCLLGRVTVTPHGPHEWVLTGEGTIAGLFEQVFQRVDRPHRVT